MLWQTHTIRNDAYFAADGVSHSGYSGTAVWRAPTVDRNRRQLDVTTGDNYIAPPGAVRRATAAADTRKAHWRGG